MTMQPFPERRQAPLPEGDVPISPSRPSVRPAPRPAKKRLPLNGKSKIGDVSRRNFGGKTKIGRVPPV